MKAAPTKEEMAAKGFVPARFTKDWLESNPLDQGREIMAKPKKGNQNKWTVWKTGQVTKSTYAPSFVELI